MAKSIKLKNDIYWDSSSITHKLVQRRISNKTLGSGYYIYFDIEELDTTNGLIEFQSNGLIKINYVGLIRINFNLWIGGNVTARPWIKIIDYSQNVTLANYIDDNSSGFVSISGNNLIINNTTKGNLYGVYLTSVNSDVIINTGSGASLSYINLEIL